MMTVFFFCFWILSVGHFLRTELFEVVCKKTFDSNPLKACSTTWLLLLFNLNKKSINKVVSIPFKNVGSIGYFLFPKRSELKRFYVCALYVVQRANLLSTWFWRNFTMSFCGFSIASTLCRRNGRCIVHLLSRRSYNSKSSKRLSILVFRAKNCFSSA